MLSILQANQRPSRQAPRKSPFIPRRDRPSRWEQAIIEAARLRGATMTEAIFEAAGRGTNSAMGRVNQTKVGVEHLLRHPEQAWGLYKGIARALSSNLDEAIAELDRAYRSDRRHTALLSSHHLVVGNPWFYLEKLRRARLALRWLRRAGLADQFPSIHAELVRVHPLEAFVDGARRFYGRG